MKKDNINIEPLDDNGLKHGLHICYHDTTSGLFDESKSNGNIWIKVEFYHGKYNGIYESYWPNGNLDFKRNFKMNNYYGLNIEYKSDKSDEIKHKKFYL